MRVRLLVFAAVAFFGIPRYWADEAALPPGMWVCRSPLIAFNFWSAVVHVSQELKIKLTPSIVAQLAADQGYTDRNASGPKKPVCIRITSGDLRPIKSGWGGALAIADGNKNPIYFHNPDDLGWVHPEYYVQYVNDPRVRGDANGQLPGPAPATQRSTPPGTMVGPKAPDINSGGDLIAPRLIYKIEPDYTPDAQNRRVQGTVVLYAEVRPNGTADNIRIIKSIDTELDRNAIQAVRQWRFEPGTKSGQPVTVAANVEVNFRLLDYLGQTFKPPAASPIPLIAEPATRRNLPQVLKWGDPIAGDNIFYDKVVKFEELSANGVVVRMALWREGSRLRVVAFLTNTGNVPLYIDPANFSAYSSAQVNESWAGLLGQPGVNILPKATLPDPGSQGRESLGLTAGMYRGLLYPQTLGAGQAVAGDAYFTLDYAAAILVTVDLGGHSFRFPFSTPIAGRVDPQRRIR